MRKLAKDLKIDNGHLSRIENGRGNASRTLALSIAAYFGGELTLEQILFPEESAAGRKKPATSVPTRKPVKSVRPRKELQP